MTVASSRYLPKQEVPWLFEETLQSLLTGLQDEDHEARIVGGAVRNTLLGREIGDIDIATTRLPEETIVKAKQLGFHTIATARQFGTIIVVAKGCSYEITSLRTDRQTDGRHAEVCFGRDWELDAKRRDFTINALSLDQNGRIYDYVGGLADIKSRSLRFIGHAEQRIEEDYLRILRFFRFYAFMNSGRPDREAITAIAKLKHGLQRLSSTRIWSELKKILSEPDCVRAFLWMRQSGVLTSILPETEKWGIDTLPIMVEIEKLLDCKIDPLLRLQRMLPPDRARLESLAQRLKLSRDEKKRLIAWSEALPFSQEQLQQESLKAEIAKRLYDRGTRAVLDRLFESFILSYSRLQQGEAAEEILVHYKEWKEFILSWIRPVFPLKAKDLLERGFSQDKLMGNCLKQLEQLWIDSDFSYDKETLLLHSDEFARYS